MTFYSAPKEVYQIIKTRIGLEKHKKFYTTSFTLSMDKKEEIYKEIFNKIYLNINKCS